VTRFGTAGKRVDRFFRVADLLGHAPSRPNNAAVFALPVYRDRNVALDPSSILVTKAGPISDKLPLIDKKSLFDAVPFLKPLCGSRADLRLAS
jgi:hypothetical protein